VALTNLTADKQAASLRIDLSELETFLAVVELGSFSAAAARMHISQPSITARVQRLEQRLQAKLLVRTTRKVEATKAGERLFDAATEALRGLRAVVQEFDVAADRGGHKVVVASTPMISATNLPKIIHAFNERFPDVRVTLLDQQYPEVIESIEAGIADLAVTAVDGNESGLRFQLLAEEELLLVVPSSHPLASAGQVTLDRLAPFPLMLLDRYADLRRTIDQECARRAISFKPLMAASNLTTLLGMLDAGIAITFLPKSMAQANAKTTRATVRVTDVKLTRRYGIAVSQKSCLSSAAQSFCDYLRAEYARYVD
jgi:DNA-binding transcriptional LysR family regulator